MEPYAKGRVWLNHKEIRKNAEKLQEEFDIRCANVDVGAGTLSGGNQQKIIIAREASRDPDIFVAVSQPGVWISERLNLCARLCWTSGIRKGNSSGFSGTG